MMLSKDFPLTHDITGKDKKKQGKQVGSQPKGWGSIYVAESENCAVKELSMVSGLALRSVLLVMAKLHHLKLNVIKRQATQAITLR